MGSSGRLVLLSIALQLGAASADARQAPAQAPAQPPEVAKDVQPAESRLQFYGIVRYDVIFDSSIPDAAQTPLFIVSTPPGRSDAENFTMHPRLTRLGINLTGPALAPIGGARITGKFEFDFQNGGRESRAIPRFRHMYLNLAWTRVSLLLGQTSDLISPLFPSANGDTLMWNAGNLGDRRPQARITVQPKATKLQWSFAAAAGLTGAVDAQDLDNDGIRDGEAAAVPNIQGRVGLSYPVTGTRRLNAGVWSHAARQKVSTPIARQTDFLGTSIGADVEVPILSRGIARGEVWHGQAMSDVRGGIAQSVNRSTGAEIHSTGGWVEAGADLTSRFGLFVGYTLDAPRRADLPLGGRSRNGAWYIVDRFNAGRPFGIGIDYLHWTTEYVGAPTAVDNRVNAYVTYTF